MDQQLANTISLLEEHIVGTEKPETIPTSRLVAVVVFCSTKSILELQVAPLFDAVKHHEYGKSAEADEEIKDAAHLIALVKKLTPVGERCAVELDRRIPIAHRV